MEIHLVIDRFLMKMTNNFFKDWQILFKWRFMKDTGTCSLKEVETENVKRIFNKFELDGITFNEPNVHFFSFNNPFGACPECEGYGKVIGIDEDLVIPNKNLSVFEDAVACWRGETMSEWKKDFIKKAKDFPIHKPYYQLTKSRKIIFGEAIKNKTSLVLIIFFKMLEENLYKIQYRVMLSRYRGKTTCPLAKEKRLRPETEYVKLTDTTFNLWLKFL